MTNVPAYALSLAAESDGPDVRAFLLGIFLGDYGYGYRPQWHHDLDRFDELYVRHPRQFMLVARRPDRSIAGTAGLRIGFANPSAHPTEIQDRYPDPSRVAEIIRVATHPVVRRSGLASILVLDLLKRAEQDESTEKISLHTNALVPAAVPFWRSLGMTEVHDTGLQNHDGVSLHTVYFERHLRTDRSPSST